MYVFEKLLQIYTIMTPKNMYFRLVCTKISKVSRPIFCNFWKVHQIYTIMTKNLLKCIFLKKTYMLKDSSYFVLSVPPLMYCLSPSHILSVNQSSYTVNPPLVHFIQNKALRNCPIILISHFTCIIVNEYIYEFLSVLLPCFWKLRTHARTYVRTHVRTHGKSQMLR